MPKKEVGPLQNVQKEGDTLKKKVDKFLKDTKKYLRDTKADRVKGKEYYENYLVLLEEVNTLLLQAEDLREENEPKQVKKFDQKKNNEIKRLENMKESLAATGKNLEPDEVEEGKVLTEGVGTGETDDDEDEEDEEDDEDDEDSDDETEVKQVSGEKPDKQTSAQAVTKAEESEEEESEEGESEDYDEEEVEEEESGEEEEIEEEEVEEEEESEDEEEESGEEESEEEEGEEEEEEEMDTFAETMRQYVALDNFEAQQEGDLAFNAGEILTIISSSGDGWLKAENDRGERGMVPVTYLQVYNKYTDAQLAEEEVDDDDSPRRTSRSGKSRWDSIRSAVQEKSSATDVLQAMGAVPPGFRESTLAKLKAQEQYTAKNNLAPKLSPSCVSYQDIFINPSTQMIRPRPVRMQRIVSLIQARQIPLPGTGVEVKSRQARMCLFDGHNVLSNIHTIRVATTDKEQHCWNFSSRTTEIMKTLDYGEVFVRSNTSENNLGILIELCLSYVRTSTGQDGEFSCGWVHLPLFEQEGQPIQNKQYDLFVHGGTPYEKGVDVDPAIGKKASTSLFRSLMSGNKQPHLALRLNAPTKDQKDLLDTLPDTMLSSTCYITYLSYYRQLLADALLQDATNMQSTELRHNPLLAIFPDVVEHPDLMDVLRTSWLERMKKLSRAEKKDPDSLKQVFYKTFMDVVYPLYYAASIPRQVLCNRTVEDERKKEIQRLLQMSKDRNLAFASLLSADVVHKPMDVSEMALNIIGPYSASKVIH